MDTDKDQCIQFGDIYWIFLVWHKDNKYYLRSLSNPQIDEYKTKFGFLYLFNSISALYGLFDAKISYQ